MNPVGYLVETGTSVREINMGKIAQYLQNVIDGVSTDENEIVTQGFTRPLVESSLTTESWNISEHLLNYSLFTSTYEEEDARYSTPHIIIFATVITLILLVIVLGNGLVIVAIAVDPNLKGLQNWFIASLAVSDLLVGVFVMPLSLVNELMGYWYFGDIICELWLSTDVLLCTASILNLCLISLDRYWSITRAINYIRLRTKRRAAVMISIVWILSMFICFPPLVGWKRPQPYDEEGFPLCLLSDENGYVIYSALGSFYLPLLVMILVYFKIYLAAREHARKNWRKRKRENSKKDEPELAEDKKLICQADKDNKCKLDLIQSDVTSSLIPSSCPNSSFRHPHDLNSYPEKFNKTSVCSEFENNNKMFCSKYNYDEIIIEINEVQSKSSINNDLCSIQEHGPGSTLNKVVGDKVEIIESDDIQNAKLEVNLNKISESFTSRNHKLNNYSGFSRNYWIKYNFLFNVDSDGESSATEHTPIKNGRIKEILEENSPEINSSESLIRNATTFDSPECSEIKFKYGDSPSTQHALKSSCGLTCSTNISLGCALNGSIINTNHATTFTAEIASRNQTELTRNSTSDNTSCDVTGIPICSCGEINNANCIISHSTARPNKSFADIRRCHLSPLKCSHFTGLSRSYHAPNEKVSCDNSPLSFTNISALSTPTNQRLSVTTNLSINSSSSVNKSDRKSRFISFSSPGAVASTTSPEISTTPATSRRKIARSRERRATLVLGIVMASFIGCWLPFFTLYPLNVLLNVEIPESVFSFIFWLGYCNSALNPIIYTIFNRDFRLAFAALVCRRRHYRLRLKR